jgi:hypothetical protein
MKRIFLLAAVCLAGVKASQAQHFKHGAGVGIFVEDAATTDTKASFTLTYSPAFYFAETGRTSFSVGVPINVGLSGSYNATYNSSYGWEEENTIGYMINVPVMFNFNIGAGAAAGCEDRMGFFIGAGYGYHLGSVDEVYMDEYGYEYKNSNTRSSTGVAGNIGIRIGVGYKKRRNIEIRTSYMKGVTSYKPNVFGVNCLFNF